MRGEVIASGLASSRPRGGENAAGSLGSTPRIGHVVRRYRWSDERTEGEFPEDSVRREESDYSGIRIWLSE
jgi:hypothetical protein